MNYAETTDILECTEGFLSDQYILSPNDLNSKEQILGNHLPKS